MVDPDILVVDEVLEVGDMRFRRRCNERMHEMLDGGTIIIELYDDIAEFYSDCKAQVIKKGISLTPSELSFLYKTDLDDIYYSITANTGAKIGHNFGVEFFFSQSSKSGSNHNHNGLKKKKVVAHSHNEILLNKKKKTNQTTERHGRILKTHC